MFTVEHYALIVAVHNRDNSSPAPDAFYHNLSAVERKKANEKISRSIAIGWIDLVMPISSFLFLYILCHYLFFRIFRRFYI